MKSVFETSDVQELIERINKLTPSTSALWGKMNVAQMLAHCNVPYEFVYTNKHPKPNFLMKLIMRLIVKKIVTGFKPYKKNVKTAPAFIIADKKEFETEKELLINNIKKTLLLGKNHFEGLESINFGVMTSQEWSNMFYNHLQHHLSQFGA